MFARMLCLAIVGLSLCAFGIEVRGGGKDKDKKFEIPKEAISGKVKTVDLKAPSFTVTLKNGKERTFAVDKATEFWGPKGGDRGTGPKGLEDDCMAKGYEIHVMPAKDGKTAKDVYLPNRKTEKKTADKE
jgi:hypothetical protein